MFLNISLKSMSKIKIAMCMSIIILIWLTTLLVLKLSYKENYFHINRPKTIANYKKYYTEYDMTVISNKNINTYAVKESHIEGKYTKLEYLDYMKNIVNITLEKGTCTISNSGNIAKLTINNMLDNKNISSLSTFGYIYNLKLDNCMCVKEEMVKEDEINLKIKFAKSGECICSKYAQDIGISSLELILIDGFPKNYIILDKNKKEYISIVYNVFKENI